MLPAPNIASAISYTLITGTIAYHIRDGLNNKNLLYALGASTLFLMSCALHHLGHAIDASWTDAATIACGVFSFSSSLVIVRLGKPIASSIKGAINRATYDGLTGLRNRASATHLLDSLIANADEPISIVLLDIDHFKRINDTYGHAGGDKVLQLVAITLKAQARLSDTVSRWGGEEFLVILSGCNFQSGLKVASDMVLAVRSKGRCTISAGIVQLKPGESTDSVLSRADKALYKAKHGGRDRAVGSA